MSNGIMMILSPAKSLDLTPRKVLNSTRPSCNAEKTFQIGKVMKTHDKKSLEKILNVSPNLAQTAHEYWREFRSNPSKESGEEKAAIYAFSGAAYQGLDASSLSERAVAYLQSNLRIIDPAYGCLRPLDEIQPYRLEMQTKGVIKSHKKLTDWWRESVSEFISGDLTRTGTRIVANVASDEYSAAVDKTFFPEGTRYIKVVFLQEGKVIAVHAKRARGLFVRYACNSELKDFDAMKSFDLEGYKFVEHSSDKDTIVFDRKKQPPTIKKRKTALVKNTKKERSKTRRKI